VERAAAEAITELLEGAIARLSESLLHAQRALPSSEFGAFQQSVGLAIGRLSHELLDPIYAEHPDLAPPGVL
jgi:hypothetical protein